MEKNTSYAEAYAELQALLQAMQQEQIHIDQLAEKLERARDLVAFCKEKLRTLESTMEQLKG